jgi:nucleoside-diphosphate-sugar epimerase
MTKNTTLVTGAPGWLGTKLIERLMNDGRKVRCLVMNGLDSSYLVKLGADIFYGDIKDRISIRNAVKNVETVFHCAAVEHTFRAKECYDVNVEGTRKLLEESSKAGVEKFIFVSSNAASGGNVDRGTPIVEDDDNRPHSHYGKSKDLAEKLVKKFHKSGKLRTVIIKPCWFYGPDLPEKMLFLVRMVERGNPLIFGKGDALKSMTYIGNVVDALLLAESGEKAEGQTYFISDDRPYTVRELYEEIAKNLGVDINPRSLPVFVSRIFEKTSMLFGIFGLHVGKIYSAGEISRDMFVSIEKAKRELGYEPKRGMKEGMKKAIDWYKENKK